MGFIHIVGLLSLLAATVLLVIASVSVPVWKDVYYLKANVVGSSALKMGNWGTCFGSVCSKSQLGYDLSFLNNGSEGISTSVVHGLTYALILTPIAAGFSFIALLFALASNFALGLISSIFSFFAFLVTLVSFAIDLGVFLTARHRLNNMSNVHATLGNAIWMVLAAVVLQLLASVTVCCTHNNSRKNRDIEATPVNNGRGGWFKRSNGTTTYPVGGTYATNDGPHNDGLHSTEMSQSTLAPKRHFWQKKTAAY